MRSKIFQEILNETPEEVEIFVRLYADLVVRINQILREKDLSKKELAEKLDKNPSEISKWLGGGHNFTLRSLAKLSAELGEPLLEVPKRRAHATFVSAYSRSVSTFVVNKKTGSAKPSKVIEWQQANELNPLSNVG